MSEIRNQGFCHYCLTGISEAQKIKKTCAVLVYRHVYIVVILSSQTRMTDLLMNSALLSRSNSLYRSMNCHILSGRYGGDDDIAR